MASDVSMHSQARYLREAAQLLAVSSPTVSAFLGSAHNEVFEDLNVPAKEYNAVRRQFCAACGNMMVPGWSCKVSIDVQRERKGNFMKSVKSTSIPEKNTTYSCLRCHRETTQNLQPKLGSLRAPKDHANPVPIRDIKTVATDSDSKALRTTNATSKQRQKARKGGLQAMLEKSKNQSSNSGGFDLMDFAM